MNRITATVLLLMMLVASFAPAAMAASGPVPHACCLRRMHQHQGMGPMIGAPEQRHGNCCPPMATASWAQVSEPETEVVSLSVAALEIEARFEPHGHVLASLPSGRGPPAA